MKKQFLFLLFIASTVFTYAQIPITIGKQHHQFFKSYEDYKAEKPVEGIKLSSFRKSKVEYVQNGTEEKVKADKLPYAWFCNEEGMLMRVFDGDLFYVLVDGPISVYVNSNDGTVRKPDQPSYILVGHLSDSYPELYYSLTPNGAIEKLKDKFLEENLEKHNLTSKYENDPAFKRERSDCVMCWQSKKANKKIKYIKIMNEKTK